MLRAVPCRAEVMSGKGPVKQEFHNPYTVLMAKPAHPPPDDHCKVAPEDYVHFVPTPMKVVHRMLQPADIQRGETIYDPWLR